jgi:hypothetical protein
MQVFSPTVLRSLNCSWAEYIPRAGWVDPWHVWAQVMSRDQKKMAILVQNIPWLQPGERKNAEEAWTAWYECNPRKWIPVRYADDLLSHSAARSCSF